MLVEKDTISSDKRKWQTPQIKALNIKEDTSWLVWLFKKEIGKGPGS